MSMEANFSPRVKDVITFSREEALRLAIRSDPRAAQARADGSGDLPTIQAAVNASTDGAVVELANGVFTGMGNRDVDRRQRYRRNRSGRSIENRKNRKNRQSRLNRQTLTAA